MSRSLPAGLRAACLLAAAVLGACAAKPDRTEAVIKTPVTGSFVTPADYRGVLRTERPGRDGRKQTVTCAEPSPDIARLVSSSASTQIGGGVALPVGLSAQAAYALARGHAEGMAQLTDRLATIQILRDAMYRACEAYANGAMDQTSYALVLAHSERLMFGLLMAELIAGRKPQPLAQVGAAADSRAAVDLPALSGGILGMNVLGGQIGNVLQEAGKLSNTRLTSLAALDELLKSKKGRVSPAAPEGLKLRKLKKLLDEGLDLQRQLDSLSGTLPAVNLPALLGGGAPAGEGAPTGAGAGARSEPQRVPAAALVTPDSQVEVARIQALTRLAEVLAEPNLQSLDGMEVGCITYLTSPEVQNGKPPQWVRRPSDPRQDARARSVADLCYDGLQTIFQTKKAAIQATLQKGGQFDSMYLPNSPSPSKRSP